MGSTGLSLSVCRCSQTAGRNSCSIVSGDVSNCSYRLTVHHLTSWRLSSAWIFFTRKTSKTIANTASHTRLFISMKHRLALHVQRNRRKEGVSSSWLGAHRPCNSDNLDGDGGGWVSPDTISRPKVVCMAHF